MFIIFDSMDLSVFHLYNYGSAINSALGFDVCAYVSVSVHFYTLRLPKSGPFDFHYWMSYDGFLRAFAYSFRSASLINSCSYHLWHFE